MRNSHNTFYLFIGPTNPRKSIVIHFRVGESKIYDILANNIITQIWSYVKPL